MKNFLLLATILGCLTSPLWGKELPSLLSLGIGDFNFTGHHHKFLFQAEYKRSPFIDHLRTQVGIFITTQEATFLYTGLAYDILLGKSFVLTPSFSPGLYFRGEGKDLGFPLEFRSALEFALRFKNASRLGMMAYHISNAGIGHRNPGVNVFALFYAIPL